jgi:hypothetical protein
MFHPRISNHSCITSATIIQLLSKRISIMKRLDWKKIVVDNGASLARNISMACMLLPLDSTLSDGAFLPRLEF